MSNIDPQQRRRGIGGSDVAGILGISPWSTPLDVWRAKVLGDQDAETEPMRWGTLLEPIIRAEAVARLGEPVTDGQLVVADDWRFGNVDGLVGADAILECKTSRDASEWGQEGTDEIPLHYLTQVAWYLAVTARSLAHVAVLIGGSDFRMYRVARDARVEAAILERAAEFWRNRVLAKDPPAPTNLQDCRKRWRHEIAGKSCPLTPEVAAAIVERQKESAIIKAAQERKARAEFAIQSHMQDAESIANADGSPVLTWKLQRRKEHVVAASESRVLRVTKWAQKTPELSAVFTKEIAE